MNNTVPDESGEAYLSRQVIVASENGLHARPDDSPRRPNPLTRTSP